MSKPSRDCVLFTPVMPVKSLKTVCSFFLLLLLCTYTQTQAPTPFHMRPLPCPFVHPFVHLSVGPSVWPPVPRSFRRSARTTVRPFVRPIVRPSVLINNRQQRRFKPGRKLQIHLRTHLNAQMGLANSFCAGKCKCVHTKTLKKKKTHYLDLSLTGFRLSENKN